MGTRCSGRAPRLGGSLTTGGGMLGPLAAGAAAAAEGRVTWALASAAAITSALVMRPPRPLPLTCAGSTFCSAIILRADGSAVAWSAAGAAAALAADADAVAGEAVAAGAEAADVAA